MRRQRGIRALLLVLSGLVLFSTGCWGDDDQERANDTDQPVVSGATPEDRKIAARLDGYIQRGYADPPPYPRDELTPKQRERAEALLDNITDVLPSIEEIEVSSSVVTIQTNLPPGEESVTTAELICTVIYGADVADFTEGHEVRGADSAPLVECTPNTSPF